MDKKNNVLKRHQLSNYFHACANLNAQSSAREVNDVLSQLVFACVPDTYIIERVSSAEEHVHVIRFRTSNFENWVVIIDEKNIQKYGRDCLTVYHLSVGIDFSKTYAPSFKGIPFHQAYEVLCDRSPNLLYRYDILMSCESLVANMLMN